MNLVERIVSLHDHLEKADVAHAFGGALALAWCTEQARATIDIDVNVFLNATDAETIYQALPATIKISAADRKAIAADGQTRLWWDKTPVDIFFNTTDFHRQAAGRARYERFGGRTVPFLSCRDLAVFKAFFNRTKDWADLEAMQEAGSLDSDAVLGVLAQYLGADDERLDRLHSITLP